MRTSTAIGCAMLAIGLGVPAPYLFHRFGARTVLTGAVVAAWCIVALFLILKPWEWEE